MDDRQKPALRAELMPRRPRPRSGGARRKQKGNTARSALKLTWRIPAPLHSAFPLPPPLRQTTAGWGNPFEGIYGRRERPFQKALLFIVVVVSSPRYGEKTAFFSGFPLGGSHGQGIFPVIHLKFQEKSICHFLCHSLPESVPVPLTLPTTPPQPLPAARPCW